MLLEVLAVPPRGRARDRAHEAPRRALWRLQGLIRFNRAYRAYVVFKKLNRAYEALDGLQG